MSVIFHGELFAGYRIIELIGWSGLATVYHAFDAEHGRTVALKILDRRPDELAWQRLVRESTTAGELRHPHIVPVYETGEAEGHLFVAMRYLSGGDLGALLTGGRRLDPDRAVGLLTDVAGALDAAHARGLVHGDVRPGNILLESTGGTEHAHLADFGGGGAVDARTDVHSLGCVVRDCLSAPAPSSTGARSAALDAVVARALAGRTEDRYPTAGALVAAVGQALGDRSDQDTAATAPGAVSAPRRGLPRTPLLVIALAAVMLGATGALAIGLHGHDSAGPAATPGAAAIAPPASSSPSDLPSPTAAAPTSSPLPTATPITAPAGPPPARPPTSTASAATAPPGGDLDRVTVTNTGPTAVVAGAGSLSTTAAFAIVSDGCAGAHLVPGAGCVVAVRFQPPGPGDYTTVLSVPIAGGRPVTFTLRGHRA